MINTTTEARPGLPVERIPTVIIRLVREFVVPDSVRGRITYFGTVRRYKGVESLVQAFRGIGRPSLSLHISGRLSSPDLEVGIRSLAGDDRRISMSFSFLSDEALVQEVGEAELVVLPYPKMHNSGATLAALSLGRPVLVPANAVNQRLGEEVGPGWVHLYDGDLRRMTSCERSRLSDSSRWAHCRISVHATGVRVDVTTSRRIGAPSLCIERDSGCLSDLAAVLLVLEAPGAEGHAEPFRGQSGAAGLVPVRRPIRPPSDSSRQRGVRCRGSSVAVA